jgi:hypothetical protein
MCIGGLSLMKGMKRTKRMIGKTKQLFEDV